MPYTPCDAPGAHWTREREEGEEERRGVQGESESGRGGKRDETTKTSANAKAPLPRSNAHLPPAPQLQGELSPFSFGSDGQKK